MTSVVAGIDNGRRRLKVRTLGRGTSLAALLPLLLSCSTGGTRAATGAGGTGSGGIQGTGGGAATGGTAGSSAAGGANSGGGGGGSAGSFQGTGGSAGNSNTGGSNTGGNAGGSTGARTPRSNALDRIDFGDLGTGPTAESSHKMSQPAATTGKATTGETYRVIAASTTTPGDPAQNATLTFTLTCDATLQNYLTVKLWGSDTTLGVIYLYDAARGYDVGKYYGQSLPEIDMQEDATPMARGRFVYVTIPIPLASTQGKTSVTLTLNGAKSFSYYSGRTTTQLAAGETTRPIYSAFSHTSPMLNVFGADLRTATTPTAPTPLTFNAAYVTAAQQRFTKRIDSYRDGTIDGGRWVQAWGPAWDTAVAAGNVPAQVLGSFLGNVAPTDPRTQAEWLTLAATYTSTGNNNPMLRIDDMGQAYAHNLAPTYYKNAEVRQRIVAALDAAYFLQSQNGAFGSLTSWVGFGATTVTTANPQGRLTAAGNAIEGNGTLALGSAFLNLSADAAFVTALGQNINDKLVPGVKRYAAWGQMFASHVTFLLARHGSAPNQDILQARALIANNQAAKAIDTRFATTYSAANATVIAYVQSTCGVTNSAKGPAWFSPNGLSLEVHGVGNGGFDGSYGYNGMVLAVETAKMMKDTGLETDAVHPVRDHAIAAAHAFSNFILPSTTTAGAATLRREEVLTFRKNFNVGEISAAASYTAAFDFGDASALHAFHLERTYGMSPPEWSNGNIDEGQNRMFRWGEAYLGLIANAMSAAGAGAVSDPSGVTFLHEDAHGDGAWFDPVAGAITFKQAGQRVFVALNWRPYGYGDATAYVQPTATGTLSNIARLHIVTPTADRIVTAYLPTTPATGAATGFSSGAYGGVYVFRFGAYVMALNLGATAQTLTIPVSADETWSRDIAAASASALPAAHTVSVPAMGGLLISLGNGAAAASAASLIAY